MLEQPRGKELSFAGNFNVELENMGGRGQDEEIVAEVETSGLEDLEGHFLPQQRAWCKDWRTWEAVRQGRVVRLRKDYILGSDHRIFQNVAVWDPRNKSEYLTVLGCLHRASLRDHYCYLGCRTRLPLRPPVH